MIKKCNTDPERCGSHSRPALSDNSGVFFPPLPFRLSSTEHLNLEQQILQVASDSGADRTLMWTRPAASTAQVRAGSACPLSGEGVEKREKTVQTMFCDRTLMCTSFNLFPEPYVKASTFFLFFLFFLFFGGEEKKELFDNFWALTGGNINKSPSFKRQPRQPRQTQGAEK